MNVSVAQRITLIEYGWYLVLLDHNHTLFLKEIYEDSNGQILHNLSFLH